MRSFGKLVDDAIGGGFERGLAAHHARRLRRTGWSDALFIAEEGWSSAGFEVRSGNRVEVLIDGSEVLPRIADDIAAAESHIHIAGWRLTPEFRMDQGPPARSFVQLLRESPPELKIRILLWAGAPLLWLRRKMRSTSAALSRIPGVRCALDSKERPLHCHHEKIIVIDDRIAYVGGMDITDHAGNRLDSPAHPYRSGIGWHDAAVRLQGPIVADVASHFITRWTETTKETLQRPDPPPALGDAEARLTRTVPEKIYQSLPSGDFSVLDAYVNVLGSAKRFIYIENQYLWSPEIVAILQEKLRHPPHRDFFLLVILPSSPKGGKDNTLGQLALLKDADGGQRRFLACTLLSRAGDATHSVYVHAKICIVDDRWLVLGSANLNEHSLFNDTEVDVVVSDPELARQTRLRLWSEHLETDASLLGNDAHNEFQEKWWPNAEAQARRRARGDELTHRLVQLPGVSKRSKRLLGPLQGFFVDG